MSKKCHILQDTNELTYETEKDSQIDQRCGCLGWRGGMEWEFGNSRYKQLCILQMDK